MDVRKIIESYYAAVNSADWPTWLTLFHDQVVVDEPIGHFEGIAALQGVVAAIKQGYSKFLMHPQKMLVEGSEGCVAWRCEAANVRGEPMDVKGVNWFQISEGRIVRMQTYFDPAGFAPFLNQTRG
jgi:ketosteroid isomerase-like protein